MYKKLASILHPDREKDPEEKKRKHDLMVELSTARKNHDIGSIFEMYRQYADPDFCFDDATLPDINILLRQYIDELHDKIAEISAPYTLSGMLLEQLGGRTKKETDNKFRKHIISLQKMTELQISQHNHLRSLNVLKHYLEPWRTELKFMQHPLF